MFTTNTTSKPRPHTYNHSTMHTNLDARAANHLHAAALCAKRNNHNFTWRKGARTPASYTIFVTFGARTIGFSCLSCWRWGVA